MSQFVGLQKIQDFSKHQNKFAKQNWTIISQNKFVFKKKFIIYATFLMS